MRTTLIGLTTLLAHHIAIFSSLYTLPSPKPELPTRAIFVVNGAPNDLGEPDKVEAAYLMDMIVQQPDAYVIASDWVVIGSAHKETYKAIDAEYLWDAYQKMSYKPVLFRFSADKTEASCWFICAQQQAAHSFEARLKASGEALKEAGIRVDAYDDLTKIALDKKLWQGLNAPFMLHCLDLLGVAKDEQLIWHLTGHGSPDSKIREAHIARMTLGEFIDFTLACDKSFLTRGMFVTSCYFMGDTSTLMARKLNAKGGVSFPIMGEGSHNITVITAPRPEAYRFAEFAKEAQREAPRLKNLTEYIILHGLDPSPTISSALIGIRERFSAYPLIWSPHADRATPLFPAITIDNTLSVTRDPSHTFTLQFPRTISPDIPARFKNVLYCFITTPYVPFFLDISKAQQHKEGVVCIVPARPNTTMYALRKVTLDDSDPRTTLAPFFNYLGAQFVPLRGTSFPKILIRELVLTSGKRYINVLMTYAPQATAAQKVAPGSSPTLHFVCITKDASGELIFPIVHDAEDPAYLKDLEWYRNILAAPYARFDTHYTEAMAAWERDAIVQQTLASKKSLVAMLTP